MGMEGLNWFWVGLCEISLHKIYRVMRQQLKQRMMLKMGLAHQEVNLNQLLALVWSANLKGKSHSSFVKSVQVLVWLYDCKLLIIQESQYFGLNIMWWSLYCPHYFKSFLSLHQSANCKASIHSETVSVDDPEKQADGHLKCQWVSILSQMYETWSDVWNIFMAQHTPR